MRRISATFLDLPEIFDASVEAAAARQTRYFVNTEGTAVSTTDTITAPDGTDPAGLRELVTKGRDKARHEIPSVVLGAAVWLGNTSEGTSGGLPPVSGGTTARSTTAAAPTHL